VSKHDLSGLNVLLIDDSRSFLSLLTGVLHGFGIRNIRRTTDAIDAFEMISREPLDLALVDYEMPLFNGVEFANMVRTAPDSRNKFISMILVTVHCSHKVVMESIKSGFDDFLAKPMRSADLYSKIVQLTRREKRYIIAPSGYFGPDRRRRQDANFTQPERRRENLSVVVSPRDIHIIEKVQSMAAMGQAAKLGRVWHDWFPDLAAHAKESGALADSRHNPEPQEETRKEKSTIALD